LHKIKYTVLPKRKKQYEAILKVQLQPAVETMLNCDAPGLAGVKSFKQAIRGSVVELWRQVNYDEINRLSAK